MMRGLEYQILCKLDGFLNFCCPSCIHDRTVQQYRQFVKNLISLQCIVFDVEKLDNELCLNFSEFGSV